MNKELTRNIRLGLFVIVGGALLIVGLYLIGNNRHMFNRTFTLTVEFDNVSGLQAGNNVRYAGIDVGIVDEIVIVNDTTIRVIMSIKSDLKKVIRKDSPVSIGTDGLMGSKLINIDPGTQTTALVNENDGLTGVRTLNTEKMLRTLDVTNRNVALISANLRDITDNINHGRGTLYTILNDTTLSGKIHKTMDNIEAASGNIVQITDDAGHVVHDVKQGKGMLGTLISDTVMPANLAKAIEDVKGTVMQVNSAAVELKVVLHNINSGNGTVGTLINDTATAGHLKQSIVNIESAARGFSENMEALKHNILLRGYFKKQEKKNKAALKTK